MKRSFIYSLVFLILTSLAVQSVPGGTVTLDTTFNGTGRRVIQVGDANSIAESVGILSNGKIVLGGWTYNTQESFVAVRVNTNGTLDTSFDGDGIVMTIVGFFNTGRKLLVQSDDKILLAGERFAGTASQTDFAILRYNLDGTLDNSFDGNGVAVPTMINGSEEDRGYDMALQPDGKIVMVGTTAPFMTTNTDLALVRMNNDGSLDTTFNGNGMLIVRFNGVNEAANAVVVQPDGKIILGGYLFNGIKNEFLMMRFEANGALDTSFGTGGLVITSVTSGNNSIVTLALQTDGKILAGGSGILARYDQSGALDSTFGSGGLAGIGQSVSEVLVLGNGKILVGGSSTSRVAISRYNPNGSIDTSFNNTGMVTGSFTGCFGFSLAVQTDGKMVGGGACNDILAVFRFKEATVKAPFDFDGDGKTDISIYRPAPGEWWYLKSSNGGNFAAQFGSSTDKISPGDFTGDGRTDIAIWRPSSGEWFVLRSEDQSYYSFPFGTNGDLIAPGDYDGDGKADAAVFRPSTATWYISRSSGGTTIQQFGLSGDVPATADYDGDGKSDIAIYRPSLGEWWIQRSTAGLIAFQFGNSADKITPGDFTGDGKADVAFWRPSTGEWFVLRSENQSYFSFPFGTGGDVPAPGDYDGDGKFDAAVFRPSGSTWFVQRSTAGTLIQGFGQSGDAPVPNAFVP